MRSTEPFLRPIRALRPVAAARCRCLLTVASVAVALVWANGPATAQTLRSRGTIDQVDGDSIGIKTFDGYRTFYKIAPFSLISALGPMAPAAIVKGQTVRLAVGEEVDSGLFVAAAAQVFPIGDPSVGASRSLWDMTSLGSVVDATFDQLVEKPKSPEGQPDRPGSAARFIIYGRPVTILFPPGCPVTTFLPANRSGLKLGTPVFVYGQMTGDHPIEVALTDPRNLAPKK